MIKVRLDHPALLSRNATMGDTRRSAHTATKSQVHLLEELAFWSVLRKGKTPNNKVWVDRLRLLSRNATMAMCAALHTANQSINHDTFPVRGLCVNPDQLLDTAHSQGKQ